MEARDVNEDNVFLQTESIDISTYTGVIINVTVSETGDHEGLYLSSDNCSDQTNQDYADVEYRIDGGAWILVQNYLGWYGIYESCGTHTFYGDDNASGDCRTTDADWVSSTVTVPGLSGNTLELKLSATNSSGTEFIRFDDIDIQYSTVMPIQLVSFTVKNQSSKVQIDWETGSEINNNFFTIERSIDAMEWVSLIEVNGAGNSFSNLTYTVWDENPNPGVSYYRLKQTDFDGEFEYFPIRSVDIDTELKSQLFMYPSRAKNQVIIEGDQFELNRISIYNTLGQDMTNYISFLYENETKLTVNISNLNTGIYYIRTKTKTKTNILYKE